MLDNSALRRRVAESWEAHRPALISFSVASFSFVVAGTLLFTPALIESTSATTWPRAMARAVGIAFGPGAVLLALLAGLHATLHLIDRGVELTWRRVVASGALLLLVPCLFSVLDRGSGAAGGVVGLLASDAVLLLFPPLFAAPLLVGCVILAIVVSTDWLFHGRIRTDGASAALATALAPLRRTPAALGGEEEEEAGWDPEEEPEEPEEEEPEEEEAWVGEDEEEEEAEEEQEKADEVAEPGPEAPAPAKPKASQLPLPLSQLEVAGADRRRPRRQRRRGGKDPLPPIELLERAERVDEARLERAIQKNSEILERTLASFRIETRVVGHQRGPVITMYELALKEGTKLSQIVNRADDLAIALKAESVRIVAPIPGKSTVGVEVPNILRDEVRLFELVEGYDHARDKKAIPIFLGIDVAGQPMIEDLSRMPHLLIAGATGSGKSVCINSIILSILLTRRTEEVRLILVDPKQVELAFFRDIPHLLSSVVTDVRKASQTLEWAVTEMEDRYRMFALFGVRNISGYNKLGAARVRELAAEHDIAEEYAPWPLPYLVVVVDEMADLMMSGRKEVETSITRLAQKSRAVGIHTVLATQRPSTDVVTGLIKANMPSRASFKVTSKIDSRVVLDQVGAEKLLGMGDMLFLPPRSFHLVRAQGCYVSDDEVREVVTWLKANGPEQELRELIVKPETLDERDPREVDDLFEQACRIVVQSKRGSASLLQRALAVGYTRASRLIDLMRAQGIIGEFKNAQAAEVLVTLEEFEERFGTQADA